MRYTLWIDFKDKRALPLIGYFKTKVEAEKYVFSVADDTILLATIIDNVTQFRSVIL